MEECVIAFCELLLLFDILDWIHGEARTLPKNLFDQTLIQVLVECEVEMILVSIILLLFLFFSSSFCFVLVFSFSFFFYEVMNEEVSTFCSHFYYAYGCQIERYTHE